MSLPFVLLRKFRLIFLPLHPWNGVTKMSLYSISMISDREFKEKTTFFSLKTVGNFYKATFGTV